MYFQSEADVAGVDAESKGVARREYQSATSLSVGGGHSKMDTLWEQLFSPDGVGKTSRITVWCLPQSRTVLSPGKSPLFSIYRLKQDSPGEREGKRKLFREDLHL